MNSAESRESLFSRAAANASGNSRPDWEKRLSLLNLRVNMPRDVFVYHPEEQVIKRETLGPKYYLPGEEFSRLDLRGFDFTDVVMPGSVFRGADIREADFEEADIYGARFYYAVGEEAYFEGANIARASFYGADISGSVFMDARQHSSIYTRRVGVCRPIFTRALMKESILRGADLTDAVFDEADLRDADFESASTERCSFKGGNLRNANMNRLDMRGANLSRSDLRETSLIGSSLLGAQLSGSSLHGADLRWAILRGADLRGASGLESAWLKGCDLEDAYLTEEQRVLAILMGAYIDGYGPIKQKEVGH